MSAAADWTRPAWSAGGGAATVLYFVFGTLATDLRVAAADLPPGLHVARYTHAALRAWAGYPLGGHLGEILRAEDAAGWQAARVAPDVVRIGGEFEDPADLGYLRAALAVVAQLLDAGGVAVVDPLTLSLWHAPRWRAHLANLGAANPRTHIAILDSPAADGAWIHTRGLRKFGRPDLGVRGVPAAAVAQAGALCQRLARLQAEGTRIADGQLFAVEGLAAPLVARLAGDVDDPRFNNTHLALDWPADAA